MQAGDSCSGKAASDACWAAAKLGFCAMQDALQSSYHLNTTQVGTGTLCYTLLQQADGSVWMAESYQGSTGCALCVLLAK
jgi:streptogramin lyase